MSNSDENGMFYIRSSRAEAVALNGINIAKTNYNNYSELNLCFCFIDQKGSSRARYVLGPKQGYIRSECFISLIKESVTGYPSIRWIKEIGDEVMMVSESFRDLLEALMIVDNAASNLRSVIGDEKFPFGVRSAIGCGPIKRINRPHEDYIGSPIDQLARIMSARSPNSNILISEKIFDNYKEVIKEYEFIKLSDMEMLSPETAKGFPDSIFYREVIVDRNKAGRSALRT